MAHPENLEYFALDGFFDGLNTKRGKQSQQAVHRKINTGIRHTEEDICISRLMAYLK